MRGPLKIVIGEETGIGGCSGKTTTPRPWPSPTIAPGATPAGFSDGRGEQPGAGADGEAGCVDVAVAVVFEGDVSSTGGNSPESVEEAAAAVDRDRGASGVLGEGWSG